MQNRWFRVSPCQIILLQAAYPELECDFGGQMEIRTTSNESFVEEINKLYIFECFSNAVAETSLTSEAEHSFLEKYLFLPSQ